MAGKTLNHLGEIQRRIDFIRKRLETHGHLSEGAKRAETKEMQSLEWALENLSNRVKVRTVFLMLVTHLKESGEWDKVPENIRQMVIQYRVSGEL